MQTITITVADEGLVTVMAESPDEEPETMEFDSVMDAADSVRQLLLEEEEGVEDEAGAMWNEEADKRASQRAQMDAFER